MIISFVAPTFTQFDLSPKKVTVSFNSIPTIIAIPQTVELIFDDLNIPQFVSDESAIANLARRQTYQLIDSRIVKVTPSGSMVSNIWLNLGTAFSYLRRAF